MRKEDIESILLANAYLSLCKGCCDKKYDVAKRLLNYRIKKALFKRTTPNKSIWKKIKSAVQSV